jgi:type I restriction enzyme S subunit
MAQALFKSWFVDFDPVIDNALVAGNPIPEPLAQRAETRRQALANGTANRETAQAFPASFRFTEELGWIPEGWEESTLGKHLEIKRGGSPRPIHDFLAPEGLPWVKIADATSSSSRFLFGTKEFIKPEGLKKTILLDKGSLILSNSATPGLPMFLELDACIHDGWLHFPKISQFTKNYLYQLFLIIREELVRHGSGSVFTNLKTDILKEWKVTVPSNEILETFDNWMETNLVKLRTINYQSQTLAKLRDVLLPKLISGELRIPQAEKMVEKAVA